MASGLLLKQGGSASWPAWTWAVGYVMLNLLATLAYYRSLQVGMVSIVSPIVASYAAVAVLLSVLTGERLSLSHGLGIGVTLVWVALTSTTFPQTAELIAHDWDQRRLDGRSRGVGVAIAAAVGYGVAFWLLGAQITPQLGPIAPVWLIRLLSPCMLIACAAPLRQDLRMPRGRVWWFLAGAGLLDTLGYLAATNALATDHQIAIVGVLISLYSAVTILLAWIFLREHL
jgi:drug/metabolite transporter (DMT)-like permease